ncbi:SGNH/GDSL hydrolase family protein [Planctomycetota bacterium]
MTTRRYLWLLGKIVFAIVYFVLAGEIFLRIFAPEPILPRYVCATKYGIRGNEPNRNYWHTTPEYRINIRTNSGGVRADRDIPYEKPEGMKRIVLLGDSFGIGYGVDLEDTFSSQLENYLKKAGLQCEVVNLSVSGHGTAEQLIALREQGFRYQPDLVLIAWHGSDLADNVRTNLYRLQDDDLVQASKTYLPGVKTREFLFQFAVYRWMAEYSHIYSCLRENTAFLIKYTVLPAIRSLSNPGRPEEEPSEDAQKRAAAYSENLLVALLKEIEKECSANGSNLLILDIPANRSRSEFKSNFPADIAQSHDFNVFSPIDIFKRQNGKMIYWEESHSHFNPLGCRLVGEGLAAVIVDLDLLEKKGHP